MAQPCVHANNAAKAVAHSHRAPMRHNRPGRPIAGLPTPHCSRRAPAITRNARRHHNHIRYRRPCHTLPLPTQQQRPVLRHSAAPTPARRTARSRLRHPFVAHRHNARACPRPPALWRNRRRHTPALRRACRRTELRFPSRPRGRHPARPSHRPPERRRAAKLRQPPKAGSSAPCPWTHPYPTRTSAAQPPQSPA